MSLARLLCTTLDERTVRLAERGLRDEAEVHDPEQRRDFEARFTNWLGQSDSMEPIDIGPVGVAAWNTGRGALWAVLRALEVGAGDEVIVPAFTCRSVTNAVRYTGAKVMFADIETDAFGLSAQAVRRALTPASRVLLVQHSFGLVGRDFEQLLALARERGLLVVEDCAHALGARWKGRPVGTFGDAAIFSLERGKVLTTIHGGIAVVRGTAAANRLSAVALTAPVADTMAQRRLLRSVVRDHDRWVRGAVAGTEGDSADADTPRMWPEEYSGDWCEAYGQRMAPVVAAMAQAQFDRLPEVLEARRQQARVWMQWADAAGLPRAHASVDSSPAWLRYPVWVDPAVKACPGVLERELGVEVGLWFTTPEHPVPAQPEGCPQALRACASVINLPTFFLRVVTHDSVKSPCVRGDQTLDSAVNWRR